MGRAIDVGQLPPTQIFEPAQIGPIPDLLPATCVRRRQERRGRRSQALDGGLHGHVMRTAAPLGEPRDIALAATLRAAALRHAARRQWGGMAQQPAAGWIDAGDLRVKVRSARSGNLILFVVDASGSMAARKRMAAAKGAVVSLLLDAYQQRDRVGLIVFRGAEAQLLVPPTNSVDLAERGLRRLPTGGRTPLSSALFMADRVVVRHRRRDGALEPLMILVTDGRANSGPPIQPVLATLAKHRELDMLVLDSEDGYVRMGAARELAVSLGADYVALDRLDVEGLRRVVGAALSRPDRRR